MGFKRLFLVTIILSIFLALTACKQKSPSQETATEPTAASAPAEHVASTDTQAAATTGHNHPTFPLTGKIVEISNGNGYSYILLDTGSGQHWVATSQIQVEVGDEIGFADGNIMHDFPSKALNKTFPEIIFSSRLIGQSPGGSHAAVPTTPASGTFGDALKKEQATTPKTDMSSSSPQGSSKAVVPSVDLQVEKATGDNAYTVDELFAKAADLNGKTVTLRAQVMKFSPMIMGKNWLHVQDGTGDSTKQTHDLVVTTMATPAQGDTILLEATMRTNQDFGYGYVYAVMLEDAVIK